MAVVVLNGSEHSIHSQHKGKRSGCGRDTIGDADRWDGLEDADDKKVAL